MPQSEQPLHLAKQDQQQFHSVRRTEGNVTVRRARFRDRRLFNVAEPNGITDGWYFEIRDDAPRGPFVTRRMAEVSLAHYIGALQKACSSQSVVSEKSVTANS